MIIGPTSQLRTSDTLNCFHAVATLPSSSYLTLAKTGYIIHSRPTAMGNETVSMRMESENSAMSG